MVIFHSYVSLPEGIAHYCTTNQRTFKYLRWRGIREIQLPGAILAPRGYEEAKRKPGGCNGSRGCVMRSKLGCIPFKNIPSWKGSSPNLGVTPTTQFSSEMIFHLCHYFSRRSWENLRHNLVIVAICKASPHPSWFWWWVQEQKKSYEEEVSDLDKRGLTWLRDVAEGKMATSEEC